MDCSAYAPAYSLLVGLFVLAPVASMCADPYPPSPVIVDVVFDWSSRKTLAPGSDNWPITWAADGHQYTSWGDGGGFGGTNSDGRVSLGVGRVTGSYPGYGTKNVWGGKSPENKATFGGKSYGILAINGTDMYMWIRQAKQAGKSGHAWLCRSTDNGANWSLASWGFPTSHDLNTPTFCQFGKNYAGARDGYVYSYFIRTPSGGDFGFTVTKPGRIDLARTPKDKLMDKSEYEFFAGMSGGNPSWTKDVDARKPVFENPDGTSWVLSVTYNAGLERYILSVEDTKFTNGRSTGNVMGFYDAPEPWGPWTTINRIKDFPAWTCAFSNKWTSGDGTESVAVLTPADSWATVGVTFVRTATGALVPVRPAGGHRLTAAGTVAGPAPKRRLTFRVLPAVVVSALGTRPFYIPADSWDTRGRRLVPVPCGARGR
jgi:hypothetical protein